MESVPEELHSFIGRLPPDDLKRVLDYVRKLANTPPFPHTPLPPGSPPDVLLGITVASEVGEAMAQTLEDCEQIDPDE